MAGASKNDGPISGGESATRGQRLARRNETARGEADPGPLDRLARLVAVTDTGLVDVEPHRPYVLINTAKDRLKVRNIIRGPHLAVIAVGSRALSGRPPYWERSSNN
jgi:hypothetical protein